MTTATLGFDQGALAVWFSKELAVKIPEEFATEVKPTILDVLSRRYNGKTIGELREIITDEEIQILEDANACYHGRLSLMADIYHNHICNDRSLSPKENAKLTVRLSKIKGLDSYQKRHELNILGAFDKLDKESLELAKKVISFFLE